MRQGYSKQKKIDIQRLISSQASSSVLQDQNNNQFDDKFISGTPKTSLGHRPKISLIPSQLSTDRNQTTPSQLYTKYCNRQASRHQLTSFKLDEYCIKNHKSTVMQAKDLIQYFPNQPNNWKRSYSQKAQLEQIQRPYLIERMQIHQNLVSRKNSLIRVRLVNSVKEARSYTNNQVKQMKSKPNFANFQNPEREKERLQPWISQQQSMHEQHLFRKELRKAK